MRLAFMRRCVVARRPAKKREDAVVAATEVASSESPVAARPATLRPRTLGLAVSAILGFHLVLAIYSLRLENPTIDEVNHLPAGISYWQTGKFKLYHHNPPLFKLVAALPVMLAGAEMRPLYDSPSWRVYSIAPSFFGHGFMALNPSRYFELFTLARMVMPLFSILGGLVVFFWSRKLWGDFGGLFSLLLWCLCPNILAHSRLLTSDVPSASIGVAATFAFWRYVHDPKWSKAAIAGVVLGLAQLTKFSLLLLYAILPMIWFAREASSFQAKAAVERWLRAAGQGIFIVAISVLVIDAGYGFEGVGKRLGSFDFASRSFLTRKGVTDRRCNNEILNLSWKHRVNAFRGTWLGSMPSPLPSEYLLGFDEQKIEADAIPVSWLNPNAPEDQVTGYPVYLDGILRRFGWRDYYLRAILYKTPEGTLFLFGLAAVVGLSSRRYRKSLPDEAAILNPPLIVFLAMTFFTDINLGIRYVLPIFPYIFIACGRIMPWMLDQTGRSKIAARALVGGAIAASAIALLANFPHPIAYFNWASGGSDRVPPRLIDSNLDWGQDLVGLRRWIHDHHEEANPIGLAYFGQISPNLFELRGEGFAWFLPPAKPGTILRSTTNNPERLKGTAKRLTPGLYAVSASLVQGLPWRVYDPSTDAWGAAWQAEEHAFGYFRGLTPIDRIGHSILVYRVTAEQADRINRALLGM